jgi:hypothetical protein
MTAVINPQLTRALRRAAVRATRAPSVHNTQPWRFVLGGDALEIHADWGRQLQVLDPRGRQLLVSCGCALFNIRVALAASGNPVRVERFPDPGRPDLLARVTIDAAHGMHEADLAHLDPAIDVRQTNRRQFSDAHVPAEVVEVLVDVARREAVDVVPVVRSEDRLTVARLSQQADEIENANPAYRAELRAWTSDNPRRDDGVPALAVPHVDGHAEDDLPIRDFDTRGDGWLPARTHSSLRQCLLLVGTLEDTRMAWLRTGEGLERILLEIADRGYAASPLTQVVEVARTNVQLRQELRLIMHPHVLLRVGRAPATPVTRRRRLVDVLTETD